MAESASTELVVGESDITRNPQGSRKSIPSEHDKKHEATNRKSQKRDKEKKRKESKANGDDEIVVTIDLTNPADLMKKIQEIDFTDSETEELIHQANEVNKLLKKELAKQEFDSLRDSFSRSVTISATTGKRTGALMRSSTLPPVLTNEERSASGKLKLASLNHSSKGPRQTLSAANVKSSQAPRSKQSLTPAKRNSLPEWNDRWNGD